MTDSVDPEQIELFQKSQMPSTTTPLANYFRAEAYRDIAPRMEDLGWICEREGVDGLGAWYHKNWSKHFVRIVHSIAKEQDGEIWAHISMSARDRTFPSWDMMRDITWLMYPGRYGYIIIAPESDHVNIHATVHHSWVCLTKLNVTPDFTRGSGSI